MPLTEHDKTLLIESLCCVVAADGRVSGREITVIAEALTQAGCPTTREEIRPLVIEMSKQILARGVRRHTDSLKTELASLHGANVASVLQKSLVALMMADGKATQQETEIVRQLREAVAGATSLPSEQLHGATVGGVRATRPQQHALNIAGVTLRSLLEAVQPLVTTVGRPLLMAVGVGVVALAWWGTLSMRTGITMGSKETRPGATDAMARDDIARPSSGAVGSHEVVPPMENKPSLRREQLDADERQQSQAWISGRDKQFQQWASSLAKQREAMDKASYDLEAKAYDMSLAEQSARGKARIGLFRPWVPTYAKWYQHYLEGFRNVCGAMSEEELRRFAQQQELEWGGY